MLAEAAKFEQADKEQRERIEARHELENYAFSIMNTMYDANVAAKLTNEDKKAMAAVCEGAIEFVQNNQDFPKHKYESKQKEIERTIMPIMAKIYGGDEPAGKKNFRK